jgi:hypothetical protein
MKMREKMAKSKIKVHVKEYCSFSSLKMGSREMFYPADYEFPQRVVSTSSFLISSTETTNEQFNEFISETAYVTESESFGWTFAFAPSLSASVLEKIEMEVSESEECCFVEKIALILCFTSTYDIIK